MPKEGGLSLLDKSRRINVLWLPVSNSIRSSTALCLSYIHTVAVCIRTTGDGDLNLLEAAVVITGTLSVYVVSLLSAFSRLDGFYMLQSTVR